jgi:hypothetical protein
MKIEKKLRKEYFEKVMSGVMNTDIRLADFNCNVGDIILFKEWDGDAQKFTGRTIEKTITSVSKTSRPRPWTEENINKYGFQTISF